MTFHFPEKAARMTAPIVASKCIKMHVSSMNEKISQCFGCIYNRSIWRENKNLSVCFQKHEDESDSWLHRQVSHASRVWDVCVRVLLECW